jgi:uncharacterized protein YqhQ
MPLPEEAPAVEQPQPPKERFFYGGQAVIEGVMMRGRQHYAVAVRSRKTGEIVIDRGELKSSIYVSPVWKLPFFRGLALLAEQLHLGMKSLVWSANVSASSQDLEIGKREIVGSMIVAAVGGLLLFIGLPLILASFAVHRSDNFLFVAVEGVIRVALVLGYMSAIALLPDVRRVFQYHGAEHKTINAFEADWPLEVDKVRRASLLHPRCGTGFLVVVLVVSVILFTVVAVFRPNWVELVLSRLLGVPLIAAVGYEWIRLMARHRNNPLVKVMLWPVLATQRFTTREPADDQIEVAIAAFQAARQGEEAVEAA